MKAPRKNIYDPYAAILGAFNAAGVDYIVVGMAGINYYAANAADTFATQDFDIFIKPTIANIRKAAAALEKSGYALSAAGESFRPAAVKKIAGNKETITAVDFYGITIELILAASGFTFDRMAVDAVTFIVNKIPVKVARLSKLLLSKKIAGRPKDKLFLKRFEIMLRESKSS